MVACDNRTLDSAIPPSPCWPSVLAPEEAAVQTPGAPSGMGTALSQSPSAIYLASSPQQPDKLVLQLPFCSPETPLCIALHHPSKAQFPPVNKVRFIALFTGIRLVSRYLPSRGLLQIKQRLRQFLIKRNKKPFSPSQQPPEDSDEDCFVVLLS